MHKVAYFASIGISLQTIKGNAYWYHSPFVSGTQATGSLKVDAQQNLFHCHATGIGGTIIDFLQHTKGFQSVSEVLQYLDSASAVNSFSFLQQTITTQQQPETSSLSIEKVKPLENKALVQYLEQERKIPLQFAAPYLQECYFKTNPAQPKPYFALHFANDKGGAELRNKFHKGSSSPKSITTIKGEKNGKICLFEGFIDFLSALAHYKVRKPKYDCIVLNSTSFADSAVPLLQNYEKVFCYLDTDPTGKQTLQNLQAQHPCIQDCATLYTGYKDFNEWWVQKATKP